MNYEVGIMNWELGIGNMALGNMKLRQQYTTSLKKGHLFSTNRLRARAVVFCLLAFSAHHTHLGLLATRAKVVRVVQNCRLPARGALKTVAFTVTTRAKARGSMLYHIMFWHS